MTVKVEVETRNKGVPGVNITLTFDNGRSLYRSVVPEEDGSCWLVVNPYTLGAPVVEFPTKEEAVEYVKGLTL